MLRKTQSLYKHTRQVIVLTLVTCGVFLTAPSVRADSPLTSTDFATAYQDVDIVKYALEKGLDEQVFKALSNRDIPKEYLFDGCGIYKTVTGVVKDFPGKQNMRSQAVEIVMKYITPHQENCPRT